MEIKATARFIRVTPMKARRVVNLIRGKQANEALAILNFASQQDISEKVFKIVKSALANAKQIADKSNIGFNEDNLFIVKAYVNEGPTMKRMRPRAQGRGYRILKRTSHITIVVEQREEGAL